MTYNLATMKIRSRQSADRDWQPAPPSSGAYRHWMICDDSLTQRLQAHFRNFAVVGVRQQWTRPFPDEARLLGLRPHQTALVREVWLQSGTTPLIFARSVLPRASLRGEWRRLTALGTRPLGAVLFGDRQVTRTALTYRKLSGRHPISRRIDQSGLWARRSVFLRAGRAILVTETFLPGVLIP